MTTEPLKIVGVPNSLYTGRARSYFIKAGIPYREIPPSDPHYLSTILPLAGGRIGLPTIELPDGRVIRDGAAIIDHFEDESGHTFSPATPKQRFFSRLFDAIGAEGLLRPAMHYRWNFEEENLNYLLFHFRMLAPPGPAGEEMAAKSANAMRRATVGFGVTEETVPVVEEVYEEQLAAINAHFAAYPYLLGGRPCIGDFGLYAPMFAHLGRDPKPLSIMFDRALSAYRWVERMGRETSDVVEFQNREETYLPDDAIPDTLIDLLKAMAVDFVPETLAAADAINAWLAEQNDLPALTPSKRAAGTASFDLRGTTINAIAQPYRFYLLKRAQDELASMDEGTRAEVNAMLDKAGTTPVMSAKLSREMGLRDNKEVWL
ncbi:MAG: glutathione S-transferase family protein [Pseudomonadota bacterium]